MRGPFSTPITPLPGSFFHADPHDRIMAGLARSKKKAGRPSLDAHTEHRARTLLSKGTRINATAKSLKIGVATVHRIKTRMIAQAA